MRRSNRTTGAVLGLLAAGTLGASASAGELTAGLLVLSPAGDGALTLNGNGRTESVHVHVNSTHEQAVVGTGNGLLDTAMLRVGGGTSFVGNGGCTGEIESGASARSVPFSSEAMEVPPLGENRGELRLSGGLHSVSPGYYGGGFRVSGKATVSMEPGVYVFGGDGVRITGGTIVGDGVTIILLGGSMSVSAQAAVTLSPPESGALAGMTIYQPASNGALLSLSGGSTLVINGAICAPGAPVRLTGSSSLEGTGSYFGDLVVADRVRLAGNGVIKIGREGTPQEQVVRPGTKLLYD